MQVVTATEKFTRDQLMLLQNEDAVICFLAGGITGCWEWQDEVIKELEKFESTDKLIVCNPRRKNFPIDDPNAAQEQIEWEFGHLHEADIFSMYFASGDSVQPICLYELGVHLTRALITGTPQAVIVGVEDGYKREQDVLIQVGLATHQDDVVQLHSSAAKHAQRIYDDYLALVEGSTSDYDEDDDEYDMF